MLWMFLSLQTAHRLECHTLWPKNSESETSWAQYYKMMMITILYKMMQSMIPWKKLIPFFSKNALYWSKLTVKTFIMLQKIYISNQHVRTISEGSCDNEYWHNSCWKFSFGKTAINYILIIFHNITILTVFYPIIAEKKTLKKWFESEVMKTHYTLAVIIIQIKNIIYIIILFF